MEMTGQQQEIAENIKTKPAPRPFFLKDIEAAHNLALRRKKLDEMYRSVESSARFSTRADDVDVRLTYGTSHSVALERYVAMPLIKKLIVEIDEELAGLGVRL